MHVYKSGPKILIIEDCELLILLYKFENQSLGLNLTFTKSFSEAKDILTKEQFEYIILDNYLETEHLQGKVIAKDLKVLSKATIVLCSASTHEGPFEGVDVIRQKPVDLFHLINN